MRMHLSRCFLLLHTRSVEVYHIHSHCQGWNPRHPKGLSLKLVSLGLLCQSKSSSGPYLHLKFCGRTLAYKTSTQQNDSTFQSKQKWHFGSSCAPNLGWVFSHVVPSPKIRVKKPGSGLHMGTWKTSTDVAPTVLLKQCTSYRPFFSSGRRKIWRNQNENEVSSFQALFFNFRNGFILCTNDTRFINSIFQSQPGAFLFDALHCIIVVFHSSRWYLAGSFPRFANSNELPTVRSSPAAFRDALVHPTFRTALLFNVFLDTWICRTRKTPNRCGRTSCPGRAPFARWTRGGPRLPNAKLEPLGQRAPQRSYSAI
jgi:hypothetical protein